MVLFFLKLAMDDMSTPLALLKGASLKSVSFYYYFKFILKLIVRCKSNM